MAQINLYDVVIPTFRKGLKTLDHILTKAEKFAQEKGLDADATFPGARLIDDQHPLTFQVQTSTKTVKTTLGRLTGVETEPFPDTETTLADLHKRVQAALDLLETADPAVVNARATTTIQVFVNQFAPLTVSHLILTDLLALLERKLLTLASRMPRSARESPTFSSISTPRTPF